MTPTPESPADAGNPGPLRLLCVGDIHGAWSAADVDWLNASDAHAVLLTGDLPSMFAHHKAFSLAQQVAPLAKPAYMIPGNHDGTTTAQIIADVLGLAQAAGPFPALRQQLRVDRLTRLLRPVRLTGYSSHALGAPAHDTALLVARPHAMGGGLSFAPYLQRRYGIDSVEASAERLVRLIDDRPESRLVVLAHNGPTGLGDGATDIWGRDFGKGEGDWGDDDLRQALDHARAGGKRVLAVVAGHMHLDTKKGRRRRWLVERDGTIFVNAAEVPRIRERDGVLKRHYVRLTVAGDACEAESAWIPSDPERGRT